MTTFSAILATVGQVPDEGMQVPMRVLGVAGDGGFVTTTAASQQVKNAGGTLVVAKRSGLVWHLHADAGPVWVAFGANPTAAAGVTWLMSAGESLDVVARVGDACAVINAP